MIHTRKPLFLALMAASALVQAESAADSAVEEVVVTADFRQTDVQSIPEATSVVGADVIEQRSADNLENVLALAPNVNFASGASRGRYIQIRGIGERSQFVDPVNPSVGLRIDDIDMTGLGGAATLFDVQQVEVLRGPQGTRFGANSLAGMINIESNAPTAESEGYVTGKIGNYNTRQAGMAVGGALADDLQGRIAVSKNVSDGYMHNTYLNRDDTNNIDEGVIRGRLHYDANDRNQLDLTLLHIRVDNGYDGFSLDNTRTTYSNQPGQDKQKTTAAALTWTSEVSDAADLRVLMSGSHSDTDYGYDEDWAYGEYIWMDDSVTYTPDPCDTTQGACLADADGYSSTDQYLRDHDRRELDVRLTSAEAGRIFNNSTDWVVGVYHMRRDEDMTRYYTWIDGPFSSQLDTESQAFYGELSFQATADLVLTGGLRSERWETGYEDSNGIRNDRSEDLWGGKLTAELLLSDAHMTYGSVARGYKAGGVNTDPDISESHRTFDTEYNNAFEVGLKSSLLDDTLQTRVAVFYIRRLDQQVKTSYAVANGQGGFTFQDYLDNAASGKNQGVELESSWDLNEQLNWTFSGGYLKTEYTDYQYTTDDGVVDMTGRAQAHAPEYSFANALTWAVVERVSLTLENEAKDSFYFSDSHDEKSRAYVLWHARVAYTQGPWQTALYGRNLTDVDYEVRGFHFGNDPRDGYTNQRWVQYGDPRLIGLEAKYSF